MNCPRCGGETSVQKTFSNTVGATRHRKCLSCGATMTEVSFVAYVSPRRGQGAAALSRKIQEGRVSAELKEATPEGAAPTSTSGIPADDLGSSTSPAAK